MKRILAVLFVAACIPGCGSAGSTSTSPTTPTPTATTPAPTAAPTYTVTGTVTDQQTGRGIASAVVQVLDGTDANKAAVTAADGTFSLMGLMPADITLRVTATGYGAPPGPSLQFSTPAGITTDGEVKVTAGGSTFRFSSVDLYSSTTPIPYVFTGMSNSTVVFAVSGRQGNTFGNFATIANPQSAAPIDTLLIRLSNPAAPCCGNPVGLDNIVVR
jgi:Carboxypeptidase regulatory-like domain